MVVSLLQRFNYYPTVSPLERQVEVEQSRA